MKRCRKCSETKPLDAFHRNRTEKDGRQRHCKTCQRAYVNAYAARNRDKLNEDRRQRRRENPEYEREYRQRRKEYRKALWARREALKRTTQTEHIEYGEIFERDGWVCGVCGGTIPREAEWPDPQSATLDHIIPLARGGAHTKANVQAAHAVCNMSKGDRLTLDKRPSLTGSQGSK